MDTLVFILLPKKYILSLTNTIRYQLLILIFKIKHNFTFTYTRNTHNYNTRSHFCIPHLNTNTGQNRIMSLKNLINYL